jgi:hypothetical protein
MAKRLIYAEDVLQILDRDKAYMSDVGRIHAKNAVNEAPTVEQKKGRWEPHPRHFGFDRCSVCHECIIANDWADGRKWGYCPECGADMRGEEDGN